MTRVIRWTIPLVSLVAASGLAVAVLAQQQTKHEPKPDNPMAAKSHGDVDRAKQMAELIKKGQLNLRDATTLAEKHVNGTALEATCTIEGDMAAPNPGEKSHGPAAEPQDKPGKPGQPPTPAKSAEKSAGDRLIYNVSCFAGDKIKCVRVDAQTKTVVDVKDRDTLAAALGGD